jgi:signal transduction histidine kinase
VKQRIVASIVGVAAIALVLLGVPLALSIARLYQNQELLRLEGETNESLHQLDVTELGKEPIRLRNDGPIHFAVYGTDGRRMAGRGPTHADRVVRSALHGDVTDRRSGGTLAVAIPLTSDERTVGAIRASRSMNVVTRRTRRAWLITLLIAAGALLVAALLAFWQARRLTKPVDELVDAAERLGEGDFVVRNKPSGIAELDDVGGALDRTAERLGDLIARERAFSADASHQLRTPIAGMRVRVESALSTPDADPRAALEEMLVPIDRLEATVDDLLTLARDTHADRSPLDVARLVHESEDAWRSRFTAEGRELRVEIEPDMACPPLAEPAASQVIDVLLANALEHGAGAVTLRARHAPGAVILDVTDEGTAHLDGNTIFERRVGRTNGIGLALARTLAEAEGGRLVLERPGPQPVFSLILPLEVSQTN